MAKFYGKIGFGVRTETKPGVWKSIVTEREYFGDLNRNIMQFQSTDKVNDDINIANEISIVADPFAFQNFHSMLYIEYMGVNWKISKIEVHPPRLILTIGGLYNGKTSSAT